VTGASAPPRITRRDALRRAAAVLGVSLTATQVSALAQALETSDPGEDPVFLDAARFRCLRDVVDVVIPETGTPGAVSAGVPWLIDRLLAGWASPARQQRYRDGLDDIDRRARAAGAPAFADASSDQRAAVVRAMDEEAYAPDGAGPTFFRELKKMTLFTFFSSEAGATIALRFERIPGDYRPCQPLDPDGRAWFWLGFSHGL